MCTSKNVCVISETVQKICELLVYFAILSGCNTYFCPFNKSTKQSVAFLLFLLDWSYGHIYLFFSSTFKKHPPPLTLEVCGDGREWERCGHKTANCQGSSEHNVLDFFHIFCYVMPMIAPWNFFLKDQVESTDSQKIPLILCACMQFSLEVIVFLRGQNKRGCRNHLLTWDSPDDKNLVPVVLSVQWKDVRKSLDLISFKKVFILTLL